MNFRQLKVYQQLNNFILMSAIVFVNLLLLSCHKEFLDKKPDKALLVPATLEDFQALMDNLSTMNIVPSLGQIAADDFNITPNGYSALSLPLERNAYVWNTEVYEGFTPSDWIVPYRQIFFTNVILEALQKVDRVPSNAGQYDQIKGSALFFRGHALFNLAQIFAAPYLSGTADQQAGIPVKLTSDVNDLPDRGTLQETYDQALLDITGSSELLAEQVSYKSRPSRPAALALLARMALVMGNYSAARTYANRCIEKNGKLIDYNSYSTTATRPFPTALPNNNDEVLYQAGLVSYSFFNSTLAGADLELYQSYAPNDLRRTIYFQDRGNNIFTFKGSYNGNTTLFGGLANDEVYLIRAESAARAGDMNAALSDLNTLLSKRWRVGTFVPISAASPQQVLQMVLIERRKELFGRGQRWQDLRRLNQDPVFAMTLTRDLAGQKFTLMPSSVRYVFPIPDAEIQQHDIPQNPR